MRYIPFVFSFIFFIPFNLNAQEIDMKTIENPVVLPYHQIPDAPESYSPQNVAARMIDGLGYRYYWATEGLREDDLAFTPGNNGRNAGGTLDHLYNLAGTILNGTKNEPNIRPLKEEEMSWEEKRKATLERLKAASDQLKSKSEIPLDDLNVIFQRGDRSSSFPFWNLINGPIADAMTHVGQIVSYRRSAGNPINPMVNVFIGKTKTEK